MTSPLDGIYNLPTVTYYPATVVASWVELEPGYSNVAPLGMPGALNQLGQQIGTDGFTLTHSMDDGLPDAVTATSSFDASASFSMDLTGKQGSTAAMSSLSLGANTTTGTGTGTTFTPTYPSGLAFWDYVLVAITVQNDSLVTETSMAADSFQRWNLLGDSTNVVGGTTYRTWVFGRKHFTSGVVAPSFKIDTSANYGWVVSSIVCPKTASYGVLVGVLPGDVEPASETVSQTAHAQVPVTLTKRGWSIGAFGSGSGAGTWSSSGNTILGQTSGGNIALALVASPLRSGTIGDSAMSASTSVATQGVAMVHVAMEIRDHSAMSAAAYFSPLNGDSPISTFERDTAGLALYINNMRPDGLGSGSVAFMNTRIFNGQMTGISVSGDKATLTGVSKTRLLLDNSRLLPTVIGRRENLTTDWITGYVLAQGGQYTSVAPSIYTRWWAPCHGSLHPWMDGSAGYATSYEMNINYGVDVYKGDQFPEVEDGPFVTAMSAYQYTYQLVENLWVNDREWATEVPGISNPLLADVLSQENSVGRFSFWIRGDAIEAAPSSMLGDSDDYRPFEIVIWNYDQNNTAYNYVRFRVRPDRDFEIRLNSDAVTLTGASLPVDQEWHFVSFMYSYATGEGKAYVDGAGWTTSHASAITDTLPNSQSQWESYGGSTNIQISARLPVAEMQLETGMPYSDDWSRFYPTAASPSQNATYRPTRQPIAVIANPTPVSGWSTLQSLAQSTLSHLSIDNSDNAMFLPLDYFGEDEQLEIETVNVLDTSWNAGEVGLNVDPTKTRNVITTEFTDTSVASVISPIVDITAAVTIPSGHTVITFTLDTPTAETHGAAQRWMTASTFTKLSATQIAGTSALPTGHFMSVNTSSDGTGSVFTSASFTARIIDWTSNSIDVEFTNNYSSTLYLANNGGQVPFLRAMGYAISSNDAYSTVTDAGSVNSRRQRAMSTQVDWIQDRTTAARFGSTLASILAYPSQEVTVTVNGDPRRVPGKLCTLVDSTGTQASGTWRINQIVHRGNGAMYVQDLSLIRVGELADWDESNWDEGTWG